MRRHFAYLMATFVALGAGRSLHAQEAAGPVAKNVVNAVWVEKEINFTFMGVTSYYSCDGLRDKVAWVLAQIGARPDFKVTARGCVQLTGPQVAPGARIVAALPVEATGTQGAAADVASPFPARPRQIEFRGEKGGPLQDGDCEFMERMRDQVLVPLGARVIDDGLRCVPRAVPVGSLRLTIEVLEPVPTP
jgi:hypothetical protein